MAEMLYSLADGVCKWSFRIQVMPNRSRFFSIYSHSHPLLSAFFPSTSLAHSFLSFPLLFLSLTFLGRSHSLQFDSHFVHHPLAMTISLSSSLTSLLLVAGIITPASCGCVKRLLKTGEAVGRGRSVPGIATNMRLTLIASHLVAADFERPPLSRPIPYPLWL